MSMIGKRIVALRQQHNFSQEKLADMLATGRSTIIRYETGQTFPNSEIIIKLCSIFSVSADYLLGLSDSSSLSPSPASSTPSNEPTATDTCQIPPLSTPEEIKQYIDSTIESALRYHKI